MKRAALLSITPFLFAVAACDPDTGTAEAPATATATVEAEPEVVTVEAEPEPAPEQETEDETEDEAEQAASSSGDGTRENPIPVGEPYTLDLDEGEVTVTVDYADMDGTDAVMAESQFNSSPSPGNVFVVLPVTATYRGSGSISPYFELHIDFVSASGRSYDEAMVVLPGDMVNVGDLFDGGTATGTFAFDVPMDELEGGTFLIEAGWSSQAFFEAAGN